MEDMAADHTTNSLVVRTDHPIRTLLVLMVEERTVPIKMMDLLATMVLQTAEHKIKMEEMVPTEHILVDPVEHKVFPTKMVEPVEEVVPTEHILILTIVMVEAVRHKIFPIRTAAEEVVQTECTIKMLEPVSEEIKAPVLVPAECTTAAVPAEEI